MTRTVRIRLNDILLERHMTKQQLATMTGLRPSTITDLCKPTTSRIYLGTIAVLCDTLSLDINELIIQESTVDC
jgi:putative transcriptional regulator